MTSSGLEAVDAERSAGTEDWPAQIFEVLKRFDVRQVPYVPDGGHADLIKRVKPTARCGRSP